MAGDDRHPVHRPPAETVADPCQGHEHRRPEGDVPRRDVAADDESAGRLPALGEEIPAGAEDAGKEEEPADAEQGGAPEPEARHQREGAGGVQDPGPVCDPDAADGDAEGAGKELVERAVDGGGQHAEGEDVGDGEEARRQKVAGGEVTRAGDQPDRADQQPEQRGGEVLGGEPEGGRMRRPRDREAPARGGGCHPANTNCPRRPPHRRGRGSRAPRRFRGRRSRRAGRTWPARR